MSTTEPRMIARRRSMEVWAAYDRTARVWELFASPDCSDYLGCADTIAEAHQVARLVLAEHFAA